MTDVRTLTSVLKGDGTNVTLGVQVQEGVFIQVSSLRNSVIEIQYTTCRCLESIELSWLTANSVTVY